MIALRNFYLLLFIFSLIAWSCKDETENPASSNYTIVTKGSFVGTNGFLNGTISNYNSASKELTNIPFSIGKEYGIKDLDILDDYLYAYTYGGFGSMLKKINLETGSETQSVNIETGTLNTYFYNSPFVNASADKIIVSSVVEEYKNQGQMLLVSKIYSKDLVLIDSVAQIHIGISVFDTEVVENKLIYSVLTETNLNFIYVLDLSTKQFLSPLPFSSRIIEILQDKSGDLMLFSQGKVIFIDPKTLSTIRTVENGVIDPYYGQSSFALDKKNDVLYCLVTAAQPSLVAYYIQSFNLTSNSTASYLFQDKEYVGSPLIYEEKTERIVTGISGALKFFSKDGKVIEQVSLPSQQYKIFVR